MKKETKLSSRAREPAATQMSVDVASLLSDLRGLIQSSPERIAAAAISTAGNRRRGDCPTLGMAMNGEARGD